MHPQYVEYRASSSTYTKPGQESPDQLLSLSNAPIATFYQVKAILDQSYNLKQISHDLFETRKAVAWKATDDDECDAKSEEVVRVGEQPSKKGMYDLNLMLYQEQAKGRSEQAKGSSFFPEILRVDDKYFPLFIIVENNIVGVQLLTVIRSCEMDPRDRMAFMSFLFLQICEGLDFLHRSGFTHNDLSPDNILVENTGGRARIKIIDFDSAVNIHDNSNARLVDRDGTIFHQLRGLELAQKDPYQSFECWKTFELLWMNPNQEVYFDFKSADTFSLTVLFIEMLTGETPPGYAFHGARDLAFQFGNLDEPVSDRHKRTLEVEFDKSFHMYYGVLEEQLERLESNGYSAELRENIQDNLLDEVVGEPTVEVREWPVVVVKVERLTVEDVFRLSWLHEFAVSVNWDVALTFLDSLISVDSS